MEVTYHLTEEDYLQFNRFHIRNSKTFKRALVIQRVTGPIIFLLMAFIFSSIGNLSFATLLVPFIILSVLWIVFYPKYFYASVIRNTKKVIKEGKTGGDLLGKHQMILNETGIIDLTENGETKVVWSGILELKEDEYNIYVYNSSVSAYILPKRDLNNVAEVWDYLRANITGQH